MKKHIYLQIQGIDIIDNRSSHIAIVDGTEYIMLLATNVKNRKSTQKNSTRTINIISIIVLFYLFICFSRLSALACHCSTVRRLYFRKHIHEINKSAPNACKYFCSYFHFFSNNSLLFLFRSVSNLREENKNVNK